jgi:hypothetical protein
MTNTYQNKEIISHSILMPLRINAKIIELIDKEKEGKVKEEIINRYKEVAHKTFIDKELNVTLSFTEVMLARIMEHSLQQITHTYNVKIIREKPCSLFEPLLSTHNINNNFLEENNKLELLNKYPILIIDEINDFTILTKKQNIEKLNEILKIINSYVYLYVYNVLYMPDFLDQNFLPNLLTS